jgi:peptidoglycan/xylan/chitin deacetylase (PgdA/CDA1 family)
MAYGVSLQALCDRYFMNESELCFLAREPLASIGAHTATHPALSTLDAANASREMADNRAYLQTYFDLEVMDLAYPFGSPLACGVREARLAAEAGFRTAATTSNRPLFGQDDHDLFSLARVSVHPHWTLAHVDAAISGLTVPTVRRLVPN